MKTIMTFAFFICSFTTFGFLCPNCAQYMLDGDAFCPNCGLEKSKIPKVAPERIPPTSPQSNRQHLQSAYGKETEDRSESGDSLSMVGDRCAGIGRGIATVALSPLNLFRGMVAGLCWTEAMDKGAPKDGSALYLALLVVPVGTVFSSFVICADAINGTFDVATGGYYGDWLYDSEASGKPTPWVWERKWNTGEIPWIDRK